MGWGDFTQKLLYARLQSEPVVGVILAQNICFKKYS